MRLRFESPLSALRAGASVVLFAALLGSGAACVFGSRSAHARAPAEVEPIYGLGFFRDEQVQAQRAVARWAEAHGHPVYDVDDLEQAFSFAAEGRAPQGGPVCGKPLSRYEARERWGTTLGLREEVHTSVDCPEDAGCTLSVEAGPVTGFGAASWVVEAPLAPQTDGLAALEATLPSLKVPPPETEGGVGGLGMRGSSGPVTIQEKDELRSDVWPSDLRAQVPKAPDDEALFPGLTVADVRACDSSEVPRLSLKLEVNAQGAMGRCEAEERVDERAGACLCQRLGAVMSSAPALLRGHRWTAHLRVVPRDVVTADHAYVLSGYWNTHMQRVKDAKGQFMFKEKVSDPSLLGWLPGPGRAAAECFTDTLHETRTVASRWGVWFDATGRATKAVQQKGFPLLSKDAAACVEQVMLTSVAPCPAQAGLWAEAIFKVSARKVGEKQHLGDVLKPSH